MRTTLLMGFLMAVEVWAQRPQAPRFPQHSTGWPAVLPPQVQNHGTGLAASVSGRPIPLGPPRGSRPFYPIATPIWYPPVQQQQPIYWVQPQPQLPLTVVQQQHAPVVTTNPNYVPDTAKPVMREYFAESKPYEAAEAKKTAASVTLIAFKDGTLVQAVAYWYENGTLHYVKPDHKVASAALTLVDKESSERFNRERGLSFRMPE
jgi:hypothetical protein